MYNKVIVTILSGFIIVDALLIYLALTISPIKLKRDSFTFQYGEEVATNVEFYVNANPSVLENVKLDLSAVSLDVGVYKASIEYFGEKQEFQIQIVDTVKPKVELKKVEWHIQLGEVIRAKDLIKSIDDRSATTAYFYNEETEEKTEKKSYNTAGSNIERIIVEDAHGNQSAALRVKIVVESNKVPPKILGADDITIHVGDEINLYHGVQVIDDLEGDITLRLLVEGEVNTQVAGEYQVVYVASDNVGNIAKVVRKVTVVEDDN